MAFSLRSGPVGARFWDRALDLVFPQRCVTCGDFGALVCETCDAMMSPAAPPRCHLCWVPHRLGQEHDDCHRCNFERPAFSGVRSAFVYEGVSRDVVLSLKFRGLSSIAPSMSEDMAERFAVWNPAVDTIVPVPLASARRRERGYDQAELLAEELSRLLHISYEPRALTRRKMTHPQALQSDEVSRRRNVADAFAPGRRRILGRVLLIDDVVTTGATLDACARVLLSEGAETVYAMTYARED